MTKEEAIEVYNGLINTKIKEAFEFFVPELRKSKNESIRRELVQFITDVKNISEDGRYSWQVRENDAEMCTRFLEYLEKQKEATCVAEIIDRLSEKEQEILFKELDIQKKQKPIDMDFVSVWLRKHIKTYINSEYNEFHKAVEYDGSIDIERLIEDLKKAIEQWNLKEE